MPEFPRVAIEFCTACKWNLRASWYLQELLSTFGQTLGEVALIPRTGGIFIVRVQVSEDEEEQVIWDRTVQGGFPDSKELKRLVRDLVSPGKGLGHVDRLKAKEGLVTAENTSKEVTEDKTEGEACPNIN